jgi:mannose-6-phosphate isomerase-like protein (cupin superfamily)
MGEFETMRLGTRISVAIGLVACGYVLGRAQTATLKSGVVTAAQAAVADSGTWGEFRRSFGGPSSASAEVLSGIGDLKAGTENHPPHTHVDEEFIYLAEGTGTWTLGDTQIPAKAGDTLYAEPNVLHGFKNTSDKPARFFVVKWRTK